MSQESSGVPVSITEDQLLEVAGGDMFARASWLSGRVTRGPWSRDGAHLWGVTHRGSPSIMGIGDAHGAAELLPSVLAEHPDLAVASLPRGWVEHLSGVPVAVRDHWDWFATTSAPQHVPGTERVGWLVDADDEIRSLLSAASPETSAWPGDERVHRWAGIRDGDGQLVAVLADTSKHVAVGHISSVATVREHRRHGYGAALTAWATQRFLADGAAMVTLGMYADNHGARSMYERLGFTCCHRFTSATVGAPVDAAGATCE